jgi:hypothetical protein
LLNDRNVLCVLVHCRDVAPTPPPPVSLASCEKQQLSDVAKLVDKTVGLQFGLVCPEVGSKPSKKSVSEFFDHTLYIYVFICVYIHSTRIYIYIVFYVCIYSCD